MSGAAKERLLGHLGALSDATRLRILRLLELEELSVGELAKVVQLPQSTVSRHLKALHTAGWLSRRTEGTASFVRLDVGALEETAGQLWRVVRDSDQDDPEHARDVERMHSVLDQRRVDARAWFGRVAANWAQVRRELFGDAFGLPALLTLLPAVLTVVDLGCGTGEELIRLAPVVRQVIGVDHEPAMLEAARKRVAELPNAELREGTLTELPLADDEADAGIAMFVLHHLEDVAAALREAQRVIRPGGKLVVLDMVEHDRAEYRYKMGHRHLGFSRQRIEELAAAAALEIESLRVLPADPDAQGPPLFVAALRVQ